MTAENKSKNINLATKSVKKVVKKATRKKKLDVVGRGKKQVKNNAPAKQKNKKKKKNKLKAFAVIVVSGESVSKSMEVMSILASDSSEAMHLASLICVNRNTPNDVIIGALNLKDVKKIAAFLEKSEFIGIN